MSAHQYNNQIAIHLYTLTKDDQSRLLIAER